MWVILQCLLFLFLFFPSLDRSISTTTPTASSSSWKAAVVGSVQALVVVPLRPTRTKITRTTLTTTTSTSTGRTNPPLLVLFDNNNNNNNNQNDSPASSSSVFPPTLSSSSSYSREDIERELLEYLEKRKQVGADERAQKEVGKVIGGTKGNVLLDFVSAAPNKEQRIDRAPQVLDYDELIQYGYEHLVTPIMDTGGRLAWYKWLNLPEPPPLSSRTKNIMTLSEPNNIVIDRIGANDPNRYTGLKLGQVMDDTLLAQALEQAEAAARKNKQQQQQQPKINPTNMTNDDKNIQTKEEQEEATIEQRNVGKYSFYPDYTIPFSDRPTTTTVRSMANPTPDWTPERLDEYGKMQGRVEAWARQAKEGQFISDPYETWGWSMPQQQQQDSSLSTSSTLSSPPVLAQIYSVFTTLFCTIAFGKSTQPFVEKILSPLVVPSQDHSNAAAATGDDTFLVFLSSFSQSTLQGPAVVLIVLSALSLIDSYRLAQEKNRNVFLWSIKGWLGGPVTRTWLQTLPPLITNRESNTRMRTIDNNNNANNNTSVE